MIIEEASVIESSLVNVFQYEVVIEHQRWFRLALRASRTVEYSDSIADRTVYKVLHVTLAR